MQEMVSKHPYFTKKNQRGNMQGLGIFVFLLFMIGLYFLYTFLPPWYNSWKAKSDLKELFAGVSVNNADEDSIRDKIKDHFEKKYKTELSDDDINVEIDSDNSMVKVEVQWKVKITYPFTKKFTTKNYKISSNIQARR